MSGQNRPPDPHRLNPGARRPARVGTERGPMSKPNLSSDKTPLLFLEKRGFLHILSFKKEKLKLMLNILHLTKLKRSHAEHILSLRERWLSNFFWRREMHTLTLLLPWVLQRLRVALAHGLQSAGASPIHQGSQAWSQVRVHRRGNRLMSLSLSLFFKDFIYLFLERRERREKERETSMCGCLLCVPYWGPGPHPRHVP